MVVIPSVEYVPLGLMASAGRFCVSLCGWLGLPVFVQVPQRHDPHRCEPSWIVYWFYVWFVFTLNGENILQQCIKYFFIIKETRRKSQHPTKKTHFIAGCYFLSYCSYYLHVSFSMLKSVHTGIIPIFFSQIKKRMTLFFILTLISGSVSLSWKEHLWIINIVLWFLSNTRWIHGFKKRFVNPFQVTWISA